VTIRLQTLIVLLAMTPQATPTQPAQRQPPPDTEIFLAPLTISGDRIEVGAPKNISKSPGYDNQPSFTRDGTAILFTSIRGGTQTDIYRYDLSGERVSQLTNTPESEYSPTETPDGGISVIRVEGDGTQRLWRFTADGRDPRVILDAVKPVGYHAWADDHTLALFILGQTGTNQPSTLRIADSRTGAVRQVASDIGRSVLRLPGTNRISFVQREKSGEKTSAVIKELDPASGAIKTLIAAVEGEGDVDCAWTPDGTLVMARGGRLYGWRANQSSANGWREVASLERLGLRGVTRLAVNGKGTLIAMVANPN
jgi:Tol biopolymer transport system component